MKYNVQYDLTVNITKEIEAGTQEEANRVAKEESEILSSQYTDALSRYEVIPLKRFSLKDDTLLLDNVPLKEGQMLLVKRGKGEAIPGRLKRHAKYGWVRSHMECIGHTYLDKTLNEKSLKGYIATTVEDE